MKNFKLLIAFVAALLVPALAFAQSQISGVVTSSEDGQPVVGATVYVEGTMLGTVTDAKGAFTLRGIPASAKSNQIIVSCIGYEVARVAPSARLNVTLAPDKMLLDEVVVTALGITKSQKTLGYSATTV